ncbi:acyl-CoA thioesterase [Spirillospora sp. CA-294931]|uniref:acyl-CoA thioesterase n=1 Tax=Spirillospora sp. CA-294931 TaxID=3240042 RepID=UPI003D8A6429
MTPYFEVRHIVGLDETNVVGNVYFAHFVRWQGRCRELFLRERVPGLIAELGAGLKIFTLSCSCEYLAEVFAFDEIAVRMRLAELSQTQVAFMFDYMRVRGEAEELVATGRQRVLCMRAEGDGMRPARVPAAFRRALTPFLARSG